MLRSQPHSDLRQAHHRLSDWPPPAREWPDPRSATSLFDNAMNECNLQAVRVRFAAETLSTLSLTRRGGGFAPPPPSGIEWALSLHNERPRCLIDLATDLGITDFLWSSSWNFACRTEALHPSPNATRWLRPIRTVVMSTLVVEYLFTVAENTQMSTLRDCTGVGSGHR